MPKHAFALLALGLVAGCSSHSTGPLEPPVEVHGVLRMTGGPAGATEPSVPGRVRFVGPRKGGDTLEVPTAANGTFSLELNPGSYTVTGRSPQYDDGNGICRTNGDVVIKARRNSPITVACDRK